MLSQTDSQWKSGLRTSYRIEWSLGLSCLGRIVFSSHAYLRKPDVPAMFLNNDRFEETFSYIHVCLLFFSFCMISFSTGSQSNIKSSMMIWKRRLFQNKSKQARYVRRKHQENENDYSGCLELQIYRCNNYITWFGILIAKKKKKKTTAAATTRGTSAARDSCKRGKSHKTLHMINNMLNLHPQASTCM